MSRIPSLVDNTRSGNVRSLPTVPMRVERYTAQDIQAPEVLARLLTKLHQNMGEVTSALRGDPANQATTFYGYVAGTGGTRLRLTHNFGRSVLWHIVGWRGNGVTSAPILVSDELDATGSQTTLNILALRSYVAGTVDIRVWGL